MNKKLRAKRKLLGFSSSGDWIGMTYDELRMFADSFVQPVNFVTEEAINSAVSVISDTLIWVGYPKTWVELEFAVEFEGLLKHYYFN